MPKRACDGCSIRKIRCEAVQPCRACLKAGISCTFLKAIRKGGPRKPTARTIQAIERTQESATATAATCTTTDNRFPVSILAIYLEIYHHRLYPVWPVLQYKELLVQLQDQENVELYALATALSGAVMAQLQLEEYYHAETGIFVSSERLTAEATRARTLFDFREKPSVYAILTSLFFHVVAENQGKTSASSLHLREAITFVQILFLDRENTYETLPVHEAELLRRIFWLLFVTERGHSIVHNLPFVLDNTIRLPTPNTTTEPLLAGFMNLAHLFANLDKAVINAWTSRSHWNVTKELIEKLQTQLDGVYPHAAHTNEVQKADILVTKNWMRTICWQVSMSQGFLSSTSPGSMNWSFPAHIAADLLSATSTISKSAIEAHGPGMELKLFEVTNSLADVIKCIPSLSRSSSWQIGPRDHLRSLADLLVSFRGGNVRLLTILKTKTSPILFEMDPLSDRILELPDDQLPEDTSPTSTSVSSTQEGYFGCEMPIESNFASPLVSPMHSRFPSRRTSETIATSPTVSTWVERCK